MATPSTNVIPTQDELLKFYAAFDEVKVAERHRDQILTLLLGVEWLERVLVVLREKGLAGLQKLAGRLAAGLDKKSKKTDALESKHFASSRYLVSSSIEDEQLKAQVTVRASAY